MPLSSNSRKTRRTGRNVVPASLGYAQIHGHYTQTKEELFVPYVYGKSRAKARDRVYQAYAQALSAGEIPKDD